MRAQRIDIDKPATIPADLMEVLEANAEGLLDGCYKALAKTAKEAEAIGYDVDYYLTGEITSIKRIKNFKPKNQ